MYERFKKLIEEKGIKTAEVARQTGIHPSMFTDWKKGKSSPKIDKLQKIADYFGVRLEYLTGASPYRTDKELLAAEGGSTLNPHYKAKVVIPWKDNVQPVVIEKEFISIPVYGSVPAGVPIEAIQNIIDNIALPSDFLSDDMQLIGLRVSGDSMYPMYMDGDTIIVAIQNDCESGQDAVVYVNGYDATLKTVIKNDDGTITLRPRNPEYMEKTYGPSDAPIQILGPVVRQIR
jgi:SOS-response transcriptional repressor LexA